MRDKQGKWVTIKGRRVFIPKGKKLKDVFDYGNNKEDNYEDDLGESIYSNKHGSIYHDGNIYRIKDNHGNEIGDGFSTDEEAIEYLENEYEDSDYEDDVGEDDKEATNNVNKEDIIKNNLDKLEKGPRRGLIKSASKYLTREGDVELNIRKTYLNYKERWIDERYGELDNDSEYDNAEDDFERTFGTLNDFIRDVKKLEEQ